MKIDNDPFWIVGLEMQGIYGSAVNTESNFFKTGREAVLEIGREGFRIKNHVLLAKVKDAAADNETQNY